MALTDTLIIKLLNHIPLVEIATFAGVILSLWIMETLVCKKSHKIKLAHAVPNLLFIITGLPVQLSLSVIVLIISHWCRANHWGLIYELGLANHVLLKYLIGFLILDLLDYLYHVMMHKTGIFWKFHQVHHGDEQIDVSTTLREHPGETVLRVCFLGLWVFFSGASFGLLVIRQVVQTASNILAHSELRFSSKAERILGLLLVTPHIHSIHHHNRMPFTDSNYGDVLCIWDRLFGTFRKMEDSQICHGLDTLADNNCTGFICLMKIPFLKVKDSSLADHPL